jgi:hypothetical protein
MIGLHDMRAIKGAEIRIVGQELGHVLGRNFPRPDDL